MAFLLTSARERPEGNKLQQDIHAVKLLRTFIYHSFEAKTSVPFLWWKEFVRGGARLIPCGSHLKTSYCTMNPFCLGG
ncbi:uncharacterized protein LOC112532107 isoform X4 [Gallus gallus]|uniref:uncharacterized protein LOC112532107 isoform X4 n=1 Tax=Gallus gallus TaxID=9031 RepID=UPI001F0318C2|nr:uncharacterized protein LOC112532107 isoform X4 [Gallus gallus]